MTEFSQADYEDADPLGIGVVCADTDIFTPLQLIFRCVILPTVCLTGIFCNVVNTFVFAQKAMRKQSFNLFFLFLSMSDAVVLISAMIVFVFPAIAELVDWLPLKNASIRILLVFYPIGQVALTASVYLTVMVTFHRYIAVCHPFTAARHYYGSKIVVGLIVVVILFANLFNTTRWLELNLTTCYNMRHKLYETEILPTDLMLARSYTIYYRNTAYTTMLFFVPFAALVYFNLRICMAVKKSEKFTEAFSPRDTAQYSPDGGRKSPRPMTPKDRRRGRSQSRDINRMLTSIIVLFLMSNSLGLFNNILELMEISTGDITLDTGLVELSSFFVNINAAATTIIYWKFGTKYRCIVKKALFGLFGFNWCRPTNLLGQHRQYNWGTTGLGGLTVAKYNEPSSMKKEFLSSNECPL